MIGRRVVSCEEVECALRALRLEPTDKQTSTGRFWRSTVTGRHVQVPDAYEGMYPAFILRDLIARLDELQLGELRLPSH